MKNSTGKNILIKIRIIRPAEVKISTENHFDNQGWRDISNFTRDLQQPFQLYRESEQTYLQVVGKG